MRQASRRLEPGLRLKLDGRRARIVLVLCLTGFATLVGRAAYLQGFNNDFLQAKGESRFVRVVEIPASRGAVLDRSGKPLAISTPVDSIWVSPDDFEADAKQLGALANTLGMDAAEIKKRVTGTEKNFVWLKRQHVPAVWQPGHPLVCGCNPPAQNFCALWLYRAVAAALQKQRGRMNVWQFAHHTLVKPDELIHRAQRYARLAFQPADGARVVEVQMLICVLHLQRLAHAL